ncbi:hypothetical protein F4780DRAFT_792512 [Xylariomycetidae sp. FL0641]|nr:hypothetical protein F4780DRAFT_792512 [Xylariomycetidae sp. FL0641]
MTDMTDSATSVTSDHSSSPPASTSRSVSPTSTPAQNPAATTSLPRRPRSASAMAATLSHGNPDVTAKHLSKPEPHLQGDDIPNSSRPGRKRAASIDIEEANHPRMQSLSIYTPTSTRSDGHRDFICLCTKAPKVPRPRNAFILYRQAWQGSVAEHNPGLANPEISKLIGEKWREQPEEVKNYWKQLAEEEKLRHQRQYPDYRYQPRRGGKNGSGRPTSSNGGAGDAPGHCPKCGGRYIATPRSPSTPFSVATPAPHAKPHHRHTMQQYPQHHHHQHQHQHQAFANPDPRALDLDPADRRGGMAADRLGRRYTQPHLGGIDEEYPLMASPVVGAMPGAPPPDKRRRFNLGPVYVGGSSPPTGYVGVVDARYQHRPSVAGPPLSAIGYGPGGPLPRPPMQRGPGRWGEQQQQHHHQYIGMQPPPRPSISYHHQHHQHQQPVPTPTPTRQQQNPGFDESLRLPPLQTPGGGGGPPNSPSMGSDVSSGTAPHPPMHHHPHPPAAPGTVSAGPPAKQQQPQQQVHVVQAPPPPQPQQLLPPKWSCLLKLEVLRSISPPLRPPGPGGAWFATRGPLIAVEGGGGGVPGAVLRGVAGVVERALGVSGEYAVRIWGEDAYPSSSSSGTDSSSEEPPKKQPQTQKQKPSLLSPIAGYVARMLGWHRLSEELIRYITTHPGEEAESEGEGEGEGSASPPEDGGREKQQKQKLLPVAVLAAGYSLTLSDRYAAALQVRDAYRADDHWQWVATLWRGVVGPDLTLLVQRVAAAEIHGNNYVEFVGPATLVLRVVAEAEEGEEGEGLDEKLERRLGFEVSEWVRSGCFKAGFEGKQV